MPFTRLPFETRATRMAHAGRDLIFSPNGQEGAVLRRQRRRGGLGGYSMTPKFDDNY